MQSVQGLEIDDSRVTAKVEEIAADAAIASSRALLARDVREPVLDGDAFAQARAATRCRDEFAQTMLELLVGSNVDATTSAG